MKVKFFILRDVIFLAKPQDKFEIDPCFLLHIKFWEAFSVITYR